jgi:hypothetical protein
MPEIRCPSEATATSNVCPWHSFRHQLRHPSLRPPPPPSSSSSQTRVHDLEGEAMASVSAHATQLGL